MSFTDHIAERYKSKVVAIFNTFVTHCVVLENPFPPCGGSLEILRGSRDLKAKILRELLFFNVKFPGGVGGGRFTLTKSLFGRAFSGTTQFFYSMNTLENVAIYRLKSKEWTEELPPLPLSGVLDPLLIDPLGRTRLKKLKTRPWTPGENKTQVGRIKANVFYRPSCPFAFLFVVIYTWGYSL